jgi:uncharacterized protein (DUF952 family)
MPLILHITTRNAALLARQTGEYRAESLAKEGFIHCSQIFQVLGVANAFYAGQKDLVLLVIDPAHLQVELNYEAPVHPSASGSVNLAKNEDFSRSNSLSNNNELIGTHPSMGQLFPHIYGPLNFDAVVSVVDFPPLADGKFVLPVEISNER